MTKFFLPLILILFIAWLVIGLQQEKQKRIVEHIDEIQESHKFYDSLLNTERFKDFKLIAQDEIFFLIPNSFNERYDLSYEYNAVLQFSEENFNYYFVLYKDSFSSDSLAFNYSRDTYATSTLNASRKIAEVVVLDSVYNYFVNGVDAFKVDFLFIRTLQNTIKDSLNVSFLSLQNNKDVYMLYFYCRPAYFEQYKTTINNIIQSVKLLNKN